MIVVGPFQPTKLAHLSLSRVRHWTDRLNHRQLVDNAVAALDFVFEFLCGLPDNLVHGGKLGQLVSKVWRVVFHLNFYRTLRRLVKWHFYCQMLGICFLKVSQGNTTALFRLFSIGSASLSILMLSQPFLQHLETTPALAYHNLPFL